VSRRKLSADRIRRFIRQMLQKELPLRDGSDLKEQIDFDELQKQVGDAPKPEGPQ
jgi:hypothetical protein